MDNLVMGSFMMRKEEQKQVDGEKEEDWREEFGLDC